MVRPLIVVLCICIAGCAGSDVDPMAAAGLGAPPDLAPVDQHTIVFDCQGLTAFYPIPHEDAARMLPAGYVAADMQRMYNLPIVTGTTPVMIATIECPPQPLLPEGMRYGLAGIMTEPPMVDHPLEPSRLDIYIEQIYAATGLDAAQGLLHETPIVPADVGLSIQASLGQGWVGRAWVEVDEQPVYDKRTLTPININRETPAVGVDGWITRLWHGSDNGTSILGIKLTEDLPLGTSLTCGHPDVLRTMDESPGCALLAPGAASALGAGVAYHDLDMDLTSTFLEGRWPQ